MVLAEMRSNWWKIAGSWRKDKVRAQISQGLRENISYRRKICMISAKMMSSFCKIDKI